MESMIFGFCLWFVVFSLLCWLITPASVSVPETVIVTEIEKQENTPTSEVQDEGQKSTYIDVDSLTLRELRHVIQALNHGRSRSDSRRIRQKVKKKDVPLDSLRAQVKARLKEDPHHLERVLAAVKAA